MFTKNKLILYGCIHIIHCFIELQDLHDLHELLAL